MSTFQSKSAFVYTQVRRALRSGRFVPGQRIDPAAIAEEFRTSATPVRFALYRLVGEGLIVDHARSGLHVPLFTEVALRDQYDWMRRLLLMACGIDAAASHATIPMAVPSDENTACLTWQLFDAIGRTADHRPLHQAVERTNDQLAPIRLAGREPVAHASEELAALIRHWQNGDAPSLAAGLDAYHERRIRLVPRIVASLGDEPDLPY